MFLYFCQTVSNGVRTKSWTEEGQMYSYAEKKKAIEELGLNIKRGALKNWINEIVPEKRIELQSKQNCGKL